MHREASRDHNHTEYYDSRISRYKFLGIHYRGPFALCPIIQHVLVWAH
jgi:hypothetical protein